MTKEEIQKNSEHWYNKYKYAEKRIEELENKIADIKANCDYILEGKEIEYREERNKLCADFENMKAGLESQIATLGERCNQLLKDKGDLTDRCDNLEKENEEMKKGLGCETCQIHLEYMRLNDKIRELEQQLDFIRDERNKFQEKCEDIELNYYCDRKGGCKVQELEQQIEKMKCCANCKYGYCGGSSINIDKDRNRTFHNWNEEKEDYCDVGKNGKYQCWEIKENG